MRTLERDINTLEVKIKTNNTYRNIYNININI